MVIIVMMMLMTGIMMMIMIFSWTHWIQQQHAAGQTIAITHTTKQIFILKSTHTLYTVYLDATNPDPVDLLQKEARQIDNQSDCLEATELHLQDEDIL